MRLIFIRHAEPDYAHDSLTEKGWREAELLSQRAKNWQVDDFFVSPLGRAQDTASFTLRAHGKTAQVKDWLREFSGVLPKPDGGVRICWDLMPAHWLNQPELLHRTDWPNAPLMTGTNVKAEFDRVCAAFDALLSDYGYTRCGGYYTFREPCAKTLVFFCHLGLTSVLLAHLWNVSPLIPLHGVYLAPSSVTVLNTEEREPGIAAFRCQLLGCTAHLLSAGEPTSASGSHTEPFQG